MSKLHLTEPHTIIKEGREILLDQPLYEITDESLMRKNNFFKCSKCKDYFDVIHARTHFNGNRDEREYCSACFSNH